MNLNAFVRTLTEITIALAIPAIIAALWGMNVSVPLEEGKIAFAVVTALGVGVAATTFLLIRFAEHLGPRLTRRS